MIVNKILIKQTHHEGNHFQVVISFDDKAEYPVTITNPFTEEDERLLEWYFEEYLKFPFQKEAEAEKIAESIKHYGENLFRQIFKDNNIRKKFSDVGKGDFYFEIVGNSAFHSLHWEFLKDPVRDRAWALEVPMIRKIPEPQNIEVEVKESPTINILIVAARPRGKKDMAYRTISRPLTDVICQAKGRFRIHILRPATYEALSRHLDSVDKGYYHIIHFDVHGEFLTYDELQKGFKENFFLLNATYDRKNIEKYEDVKMFLLMDGTHQHPCDPVEAGELSNFLSRYHIPVVILNACKSGRQTGKNETNIGTLLMKAGVWTVVTMKYSITGSAAKLMMKILYEQLFAQKSLYKAIQMARVELSKQKERNACHSQIIRLEDWTVPVIWQNKETELKTRDFTPQEALDYYGKKAKQYSFSETVYRFVGRDLDILEIEKRLLLHSNLLLIKGSAGIGKTALLRHLIEWWQSTHFIAQVFYFDYDKKTWNRQQMMAYIAETSFSEDKFKNSFQPLSEKEKQFMLREEMLQGTRHLLIIDNMESKSLSENEKKEIQEFLSILYNGKTLVLFASRKDEEWISIFKDNVYELVGLDSEAAYELAYQILKKYDITQYRKNFDFQKLIEQLEGNPLLLEKVLPNLEKQSPGEILQSFSEKSIITLGCSNSISQDRTINLSDDDKAREPRMEITKHDILKVLYEYYRSDPGENVSSEKVREELGIDREQLNHFILYLKEKNFIEADFVGDKALLRITARGVTFFKC